jgi:hypothetical protein
LGKAKEKLTDKANEESNEKALGDEIINGLNKWRLGSRLGGNGKIRKSGD